MSSTPRTFTPGTPTPPSEPLALDQVKGLGELFRAAWILWRGHTGVFLMTAALIVVPYEVIVTGLLGGGFNDPIGTPAVWAQIASPFLLGIVGTALVTAIHSRAVVALSQGRSLTTGEALTLGLQGFGAVAAATALYLLLTVLGFLLILPGLFLSIAGIFTAQIAALHGTGPMASLKASVRMVRDSGWWRTFGYLLVLGLVAGIATGVLGVVIVIISLSVGEPNGFGAVAVPLVAVMQAAVMSWTALVTTLLYFSWRAEQNDPFAPDGAAPVGRVEPAAGTGGNDPWATDHSVPAPGSQPPPTGPTFRKG